VREESSLPQREQTLILAKLDLCQKHVDNSTVRSWQSAGIVLAGAMATLALMLQIQASDTAAALITTVFAVGALLAVQIWRNLVRREYQLRHESVVRMRELEGQLGMEPQARILCRDEATSVASLFPGRSTAALDTTGYLVQLGWMIVAAWRWLIVIGLLD
jgi:hypothetical protein